MDYSNENFVNYGIAFQYKRKTMVSDQDGFEIFTQADLGKFRALLIPSQLSLMRSLNPGYINAPEILSQSFSVTPSARQILYHLFVIVCSMVSMIACASRGAGIKRVDWDGIFTG